MKVITELPRQVREITHTWIPMPDGARLAARIWLPTDAEAEPVPAIIEYIPYRKNDGTATLDAPRHPYLAGHGYASVRVDLRGSGDSDGLLLDEYLPQEHSDALAVMKWLEQQPWCTGAVGMVGYSWGGINALQIAALRPPQLRAIITCCSSDDRYATDAHYMGGCVLGYDMLSWATSLLAFNARPPDPEYVGENWRETWLERLDAARPPISTWLSHQNRDDYWRHGSVAENYDAIACPVYAIGGWADPYHDAVVRLMAGLSVPRKGLIGPWAHGYPDEATPGPQIGFLDECLRWWDHWLADKPNSIMQEPPLRLWLQDPIAPARSYKVRPGRWITEPDWPSPNISVQSWHLHQTQVLSREPSRVSTIVIQSSQNTGIDAGTWCPYGGPSALPGDQAADDGRSLCFTSEPLGREIALVGVPRLELELTSDEPIALLAGRLCAVAPSGASSLLARGLLNLTRRDGPSESRPLEPGHHYTVSLELSALAQVVGANERLRLGMSSAYWPWAWPSPRRATLEISLGDKTRLMLPVRSQEAEDSPAPFHEPRGASEIEVSMLRPVVGRRLQTFDATNASTEMIVEPDYLIGTRRLDKSEIEIDDSGQDIYTIADDDPLSAQVRCHRTAAVGRGAWRTQVEARSRMTCDEQDFFITTDLEAFEGSSRIFSGRWHDRVPRTGT